MDSIIKKIKNSIDERELMNAVEGITKFNRIQCSTGFRAAAKYLEGVLKAGGIDTVIREFAADPEVMYLSSRMFMEWNCNDGELVLEDGIRLCNFKSNPLSVIQKSYPADFRNIPREIVEISPLMKDEDVREMNLKDKLVFIREPFMNRFNVICEKEAFGIITDAIYEIEGVRTRADLYDIYNYTSFWWKHDNKERNMFGFVLTPREGDILSEKIRKRTNEILKKGGKPLTATGFIDSSLYKGKMEVVDAFIQGEEDEEVLLIAHLCHPSKSANDNASGVSAVTVAMKTIKELIEKGEIEKPKKSIRALFVPEFTGTYAYLDQYYINKGRKIIAGLNMDMVGGRQVKGYGPLTISGIPDSLPSAVSEFASLLMDKIKPTHLAHSDRDTVSILNTAVTEFDAGSDNFILSDPTIGIPTPMVGQWPDINYHTSGDIEEVIDPFVLKMSSTLCATYAYILGNFKDEYMDILLPRIRSEYFKLKEKRVNLKDMGNSAVSYDLNLYLKKLESMKTLTSDNEKIEREKEFIEQITEKYYINKESDENSEVPQEYRYIPIRKVISPITRITDFCEGKDDLLKAVKDYNDLKDSKTGWHRHEALILFEMNGKDSMYEIAQRVIMQSSKKDIKLIDAYIKLLEKLGAVEIKEVAR